MAVTYVGKFSRSDMGAETLLCEGRLTKSGGISKFHMQRNPWACNLYSAKPSDFYNPAWTGIPMNEYNPRLAEHMVSGDIELWKRKMEESRPPQRDALPLQPRSSPATFLSNSTSASDYFTEDEKGKTAEYEKNKKPQYMVHARCPMRKRHVWPLLNYCFPCERQMQYKLFTKTLQIKRAGDEAKYRSKDPWEKRKLRRGTTAVHSYHPMQTCHDDYWPLKSKRHAKESLEIYDRRNDALEGKKQEEEEYLKEHPPQPEQERRWRHTDLTRTRPNHRKPTRNQGSKEINKVLPLKTTQPIIVVPPFAIGVQNQAATTIAMRPHCQGRSWEEKEYSLDHIHPQTDHKAKYYPAGDLAFTPIHHLSKFQGLYSPRWRNKELYRTRRPNVTRYGGIHDVTRKADGTTYFSASD